MRLRQRADGLCCSIVSWDLAAVNKQIVGDLVVAGLASSVAGALQCAMLFFLQSNSKAHGRSVAHETSFDYKVKVSHTHLASVLNQMSISYCMLSNCGGFVMTDMSVIANKQQSGTANAPKH